MGIHLQNLSKISRENANWIRAVENSYGRKARIERAREVCHDLIAAAGTIISVQETNRIVTFSDQLTSQIPVSLAGHAYNTLSRALIEVEALRIARVWDSPSYDRTSIQTAYYLSRTEGVREASDALVSRSFDAWSRAERLERRARLWRRIDSLVPPACNAPILGRVTNFRDKHVAHLLTQTVREKAQGPMRGPTYIEFKTLLRRTVAIVDLLNVAVRGSSFSWPSAFDNAKTYADELWKGARFDIPSE